MSGMAVLGKMMKRKKDKFQLGPEISRRDFVGGTLVGFGASLINSFAPLYASSQPIADVYTALQTGLVDTVAAPPMGAIAFQWHTSLRYLTDEPLMYLTGVLAVDRKTFSKLSKSDQAVVREVVARAGSRLDTKSRSGEDNARDALRNQGISFVKPSSIQEVRRWHDISAQAIEKLREIGRYDDSTIEQIQSILESHRTGYTASR